MVRANVGGHLQPTPLGHHQVANHQDQLLRIVARFEGYNRLLAIFGLNDLIPLPDEKQARHLPDFRLVIDHEHAAHRHGTHRAGLNRRTTTRLALGGKNNQWRKEQPVHRPRKASEKQPVPLFPRKSLWRNGRDRTTIERNSAGRWKP